MNKVKEQKGFTLIEMLIVVAIIAILVAVSIPLVGSALEYARQVTDAANERAAKAAIVTCYLTDTEYAPGKKVIAIDDDRVETAKYYAYDAVNGKLTQEVPTRYGKCDKHRHKDRYLIVSILKNGDVQMVWTGANSFPPTAPPDWNYNLCSIDD